MLRIVFLLLVAHVAFACMPDSRNRSACVDEQVNLGARFYTRLQDEVGVKRAKEILLSRRHGQERIRMPRGMYEGFCKHGWNLESTKLRHKVLERVFTVLAHRLTFGSTPLALRGVDNGMRRRKKRWTPQNCKAHGLSFMLLEFFIDEVQQLYCRADSTMLMNRARELKADLLGSGHFTAEELPKLTGSAVKTGSVGGENNTG